MTTEAAGQGPALSEGLGPLPQVVAWMGGDGHPRHLSAVQTATDRRIYGKWTPLYDEKALRVVQLAERERCADYVMQQANLCPKDSACRAVLESASGVLRLYGPNVELTGRRT